MTWNKGWIANKGNDLFPLCFTIKLIIILLGLDDQGLYRKAGVSSKFTKLLNTGLGNSSYTTKHFDTIQT